MPVSSLYLWREASRNIEARTPWEKFKNNILMYLQILALIALILALAAPFWSGRSGGVKKVLLLIDNSGSMNGLYDNEASRLFTAKKQALQYVEGLMSEAEVTVISGNETAQILLTNSRDKNKIKKVIHQIHPTDISGDLTEAMKLASSMTAQWEHYELLLYSDRMLDMGGLTGSQIYYGGEGKNAAVDYVSHSIEEDGLLGILARITNYGSEEISSDVNLYLNEKLVGVKELSLLPGESKNLYFDKMTAVESGILKAEIHERDQLITDNTAYDKIEESGKMKALLVTEQNVFLEKAILTNDNIELYKTTGAEEMDEESSFDLYLFDGVIPEKLPKEGNCIFINPPGTVPEDFTLFQVGENKEGAYVTPGSHEINEYLEGLTFGVGSYHKIELPQWAQGFLYAGEDCVGFGGYTSGRYISVLAFDLHESDLPLKTGFPILMYSILNQSSKESYVDQAIYQAGEYLALRGMEDAQKAVLCDGEGEERDIFTRAKGSVPVVLESAGVYQVVIHTGREEIIKSLAVNFPTASESGMGTLNQAEQAGGDAGGKMAGESKEGMDLKPYILILVLLLLAAEWIVYIRRL